MEGLPFFAGGGVNLTGLQIVDITRIFFLFSPARIQHMSDFSIMQSESIIK
jgi:hypothetical protein